MKTATMEQPGTVQPGRRQPCLFSILAGAFLLVAGPAAADMTEQEKQAVMDRAKHQQEVEKSQRDNVLAQCGLSTGSVHYPGVFTNLETNVVDTWQTVFAVKSWTGACLDGKRDGHGTLVTSEDENSSVVVSTKLEKSEGNFVRGRRIGLWCVLELQNFTYSSYDNKNERQNDGQTGCRLLDDANGGWYVKKRPDGRWDMVDWQNKPVSPAVVLDAGVVEAESQRLISEVAAGKSGVEVKSFTVQSDALDGLIAGTQLRMAEGNPVVSLEGKRVALILSNRSIAGIEQFTRQRQALIDASANLPPPSSKRKAAAAGADAALEAMTGPVNEATVQRARFIDVSRPELLLKRVAAAMRRYAREVVPVDDLSGLTKGEFDYALVLDWQSTSRLDLLGKYDEVPVAKPNTFPDASRIGGQTMGGFLISPKLEAVRIYAGGSRYGVKDQACVQTRQENTCDRDYFKALADFHEAWWVVKPADYDSDSLSWWFKP
ncbi:MAG: hypothetical protein NT117_01200 [Gammaproteobacteria bacterium]|nr:hypothetical protein [Gammaproteobacteria bacterium]